VVRGTHTYTSAGHYQPIIDVTEREGVTVQAGTPSGGGGVGASPAIKGPMLTGGDFNGDGRSDLVLFVTQPDLSTKPMVVLMQSDGTLGAPIALPASDHSQHPGRDCGRFHRRRKTRPGHSPIRYHCRQLCRAGPDRQR
jgi:hypothetical protein